MAIEEGPAGAVNKESIITALMELIEALDRRVPHVERSGEIRIAQEARLLRDEAVARIAVLKAALADPEPEAR